MPSVPMMRQNIDFKKKKAELQLGVVSRIESEEMLYNVSLIYFLALEENLVKPNRAGSNDGKN